MRASHHKAALREATMSLPLARRIIVDGLLASTDQPRRLIYTTTPVGFYLANREQVGRVHDYRYERRAQTFFVVDARSSPVARVFLRNDQWTAGIEGLGELPFHFGGAKLLIASLF